MLAGISVRKLLLIEPCLRTSRRVCFVLSWPTWQYASESRQHSSVPYHSPVIMIHVLFSHLISDFPFWLCETLVSFALSQVRFRGTDKWAQWGVTPAQKSFHLVLIFCFSLIHTFIFYDWLLCVSVAAPASLWLPWAGSALWLRRAGFSL